MKGFCNFKHVKNVLTVHIEAMKLKKAKPAICFILQLKSVNYEQRCMYHFRFIRYYKLTAQMNICIYAVFIRYVRRN